MKAYSATATACLLILLTSLCINAQTITWQRTYGSTIEDKAYCVVQTNDNGYVICGKEFRDEPTRIIRTDSLGNELWSRYESGHIYSKIIKDGDNFVLAGIQSNTAIAVKFNLIGQKLWQKFYGLPSNGLLCDVIMTTDGHYIFSGITYNTFPVTNLMMVKTDTSGIVVWEKLIDSVTSCCRIEELANKGFLLSSKEPISRDNTLGLISVNEIADKTFITDSLGNAIYVNIGIGRNGIENLSENGMVLFENVDTLGSRGIVLVRTDNVLKVVSRYLLFKEGYELIASSLIKDHNGTVLAGQSISFTNSDQNPYLIKFDDSNRILMNARIPVRLNYNEYILGLNNCKDRGFIAVGVASPFIGDDINFLAIKTDSLGNSDPVSISEGALEVNRMDMLLQIYPNPFNSSTKIDFELKNISHIELKVFDILGREVANLRNGFAERGKHSVIFSSNELPSGCYFCSLVVLNSESLQVCRYSKVLLIVK